MIWNTIFLSIHAINCQLGAWFNLNSSGILTPTIAMRTMAFQKIIDSLLRRGKRLPDTYCFPPHIETIGTPPDKLVRTPSTS